MSREPNQDRGPDAGRVQNRAEERQRERASRVESTVDDVASRLLSEHKYPVTSEELAIEYGNEEIDLPNETESLGSVFDRIVDERFDSPEEAREALYNELTGGAGFQTEYNDERDLGALDEAAQEDVPDRS